ncbi:hypothetical protein BABINDRAFT_162044 [Babjeviella inositovora NRRL Y-12698]|uniref:Carnitine O-acetyltransferase, mitochondrial n=1 Tax=Babjeviella inositovora NRRL Y-12698 TaxID=984486 RepID=A0A1E3QMV3_9ASCO|nr:uncharacterized protein BABINDRAFT_162044 [Babjeviella inositovora NRRL Y-12698]ODQ78958.1 hypothetical protein BABINDRAFT_162044 [Babjeviella inositovora NRRL Y-12698]
MKRFANTAARLSHIMPVGQLPKNHAQKRFTATTSAPKGDLFKFQADLPPLPVPELKDTAAKYLDSVKPLASAQQYAATEAKVQEFIRPGGVGEKLHAKLLERAALNRNWLSDWWDEYAYMAYRDAVVPYVSYFFAHKDLRGPIGQNQLQKASLLAFHVTEFLDKVANELHEPEVLKGTPYCMESFKNLFNNSRVPTLPADTTVYFPYAENQYFLVIVKNRFYKIYHHNTQGQQLAPLEIHQQLVQAVADAHAKGVQEAAIGALTSVNRDFWTNAYADLAQNASNQVSLDAIHAASFVVCLDDSSPVTTHDRAHMCWHGNGTNRFYDKPLQFIVAANGASGFLGEHSRMDATPTNKLNVTVCKQLAKDASAGTDYFAGAPSAPSIPEDAAKEIRFDVSPSIRNAIADAKQEFRASIDSHDMFTWQFPGYGKNFMKTCKVSPDAYAQMLIQVAYYKLTGTFKPTYEPAATRKFFNGRTENCRSLSPEAVEFVKTFVNAKVSNADKQLAFQKAAKKHSVNVGAAANGLGIDRHLFGLQRLANPDEVPELFKDPMYAYSSSWLLSTSQIPVDECYTSWGFSQVNDLGFGLAYMINNDWLNINISCKKGNGLVSEQLGYYLTETALEMREVLGDDAAVLKAKL